MLTPCSVWIDASPYKPYTGFSFHFPSFNTEETEVTKALNDTEYVFHPALQVSALLPLLS
jgi:hypothetical protein